MRAVIIVLVGLLATMQTSVAQNFRVQQTKITDPDGKEFTIRGVNVNGPHWPWNRPTAPDADLIASTWKFNTVRVNCVPTLRSTFPQNNADLGQIVSAFTAKKVVVQIEPHQFTGKYPTDAELESLKLWWVDVANRFKANPYVWFNIMNEPGNEEAVPEQWKTTHEAVIKAIRATGATNIIVLDEHNFGQASGFRGETKRSGVLTYGPYFAQTYENIAFSLHLYDNWIYGQQRLTDYLQEAQTKQLSVHIGEFGLSDNYSRAVAADLFRVALSRKLGVIAWHWDGSDVHDLTRGTRQGGGWEIDRRDGTVPSNLSFAGNLVWKYNHDQLTENPADFTIKAPWLSNGSFEDDLDGWNNWGNAELEKSSPNAREGRNNIRVNSAGSGGGFGQLIYLNPGETYVLQAWGRNSIKPEGTTDLGVQYKDEADKTQYALLNFTETEYTQKRVEFTLPKKISDVSVFVWKNDKNVTFYADDIRLSTKSESVVVLGVEPVAEPEISVFPNPASGEVIVKTGKEEKISFTLINASGLNMPISIEVVSQQSKRIRFGQMPAGIYLLKGQGQQNNVVFTHKIIVRE